MKTPSVLVTGANGFIGRALCRRLAFDNKVVGVYHKKRPVTPANIVSEQADLTDVNAVAAICEKYSPAVVVHCAGIEGWASQSNPEFIKLLTYSRRSCAETQNCFYIALDQRYITEQTFQAIYDQALRR